MAKKRRVSYGHRQELPDAVQASQVKGEFERWVDCQHDLDTSTEARCQAMEELRQLHSDAANGVFRPHCEIVRVDNSDLCGLLWTAISEKWLADLAIEEGRDDAAACHRQKHEVADEEIFSDRFAPEEREVAGEILNYLCE